MVTTCKHRQTIKFIMESLVWTYKSKYMFFYKRLVYTIFDLTIQFPIHVKFKPIYYGLKGGFGT